MSARLDDDVEFLDDDVFPDRLKRGRDGMDLSRLEPGDRAKVSYRGAIDRSDVRRAVIDHLEGGDEPYKLRQEKYNFQ